MTNQDWDTMYPLFLKYFSVLCLIVLLIEVGMETLYIWFKTKAKPDLRHGYKKLYLGFTLLMGLPFIILSIGTVIQKIPSIGYLFLLGEGNIFSLAFFIALFLE